MDGFLIVNKPKGMTSFTLCNIIRKKLKLNKTGHAGTLDPNATGVMLVACDRATKLLKLFNDHKKAYVATIAFGYETDTLDLDTTNIKEFDMTVDLELIKKECHNLSQKTTQIPPMTSAIKIDGKKLYEYQRKGIDVELKERDVHINKYEIKSDLRFIDNHFEIDIYLDVSKGYYIRAFARDLGLALGGMAVLKELKRVSVDEYTIDEAIDLDSITEESIIKIEDFLKLDSIEVSDYIAKLVKNGVTLDERQTTKTGVFYVRNKCDIIAIYESVIDNRYKPILIF